jgi:hypothetical protein
MTVPPDALPESPRGYEVVDRVAWPSGAVRLPADRQEALGVWAALRGLDAMGDLGLTPQPTRPMSRQGLPPAATTMVGAVVAVYLACIMGMAIVVVRRSVRRRRMGAWRMYAGLAVVTLAGTVLAAGAGQVGPGRSLRLHHSSLLQQVPGTETSLLTIRGLIEFPALDTYAVTLSVADGAIEAFVASGRAEQGADEDGRPVLAGRFGLGARQSFWAEAAVGVQPLVVRESGSGLHVTNALDRPLSDCRFADGFSVTDAGDLNPGESAAADQVDETIGPIFTCMLRGALPVGATEARRAVEEWGETLVVVYRRPRMADGAGSSCCHDGASPLASGPLAPGPVTQGPVTQGPVAGPDDQRGADR